MATKAIIRSAVLSAASENSALLNRLSATSEAPSIFRSHALHISRLEGLLSEQDQLIQSLKSTVESRFRSHKKLRDSKLRRLYLRATGMLDAFEVRAMATEREYFVMLANQSKAEERQREIRRDLEGAVQAQKPLEQAAKEHEQVHERIDALYEGLFAGPTPGFDREDEKEMAFYTARERNDATKEKILGARRVLKLLGHVTRCLNRAEHHIKTAEQEADNSTFFFADARRILSGSTGYITSAISAIDRAGEVLGELAPDMRAVRLLIHQQLLDAQRQSEAQTSPDAMIAAIFTAKVRVAEAKESANRFQELAKQREQASLEEIKTTARQLEDRRQALYQIRLGIFEDVAGFGEAAPPYTECCDRSSSFCRVPDELHDDDVGLVEMADGPESLCGRTSQSTLPAYGYSLPLVTTTLELPPPRRDAQLLAEKPPAFGVNGTKVGNL